MALQIKNQYCVQVCIVGAGATGLSIAARLARTDISCVVIEQGSIGGGATHNCAGVLHSGARYAVTDPDLATMCYSSRQKFEEIAPFAITCSNEALYIITDGQSEHYSVKLSTACEQLTIPTRVLAAEEVRRLEPNINTQVIGAVAVPDIVIDPFILTKAYEGYLQEAAIPVLPMSPINSIGQTDGGWLIRLDRLDADEVEIECQVCIVAAGAWTSQVLHAFGVTMPMSYANGSMFAIDARLFDRIVSLCSPSSSNDSVIPCYESVLVGSTWSEQRGPDPSRPSDSMMNDAVNQVARILPSDVRPSLARSYSAVRTINNFRRPTDLLMSRRIPRSYEVIDHSSEDGVTNLLSVCGGKLTIHDRMSLDAAALACKKLNIEITDLSIFNYSLAKPARPAYSLGSERPLSTRNGQKEAI